MPESRGLLQCQGQWRFDDVLLLLTKAWAVHIHALSSCSQASSSRLEASKSKLEASKSKLEALESAPESSKPGLKASKSEFESSNSELEAYRRTAIRASPPSGNILDVTLSAREPNDDDDSITDNLDAPPLPTLPPRLWANTGQTSAGIQTTIYSCKQSSVR